MLGGREEKHLKDLDWHNYFVPLCMEFIQFIDFFSKSVFLCVPPLCAIRSPLRAQALSSLRTDGGIKREKGRRKRTGGEVKGKGKERGNKRP